MVSIVPHNDLMCVHITKWSSQYILLTSITTHDYSSFLVMRTFKVNSLSNFQTYNTVLSTVVTMVYITFSGLTECYNCKLIPFDLLHPVCPPPLATTNLFPVSSVVAFVCLCVCFWFPHTSEIIPFLLWLTYQLSIIPLRATLQKARFPSFCGSIIFHQFIHPWTHRLFYVCLL